MTQSIVLTEVEALIILEQLHRARKKLIGSSHGHTDDCAQFDVPSYGERVCTCGSSNLSNIERIVARPLNALAHERHNGGLGAL